jgi:hypothetical protein
MCDYYTHHDTNTRAWEDIFVYILYILIKINNSPLVVFYSLLFSLLSESGKIILYPIRTEICLSIYLSIYLYIYICLSVCPSFRPSMYLSICLSVGLSDLSNLSMALTALLDLGRFFSFLIIYRDGRIPWMGNQPVAGPLPTHRTTQTQNKRIYRHPCLELDSNRRSQTSSGRGRFMP